MAAVPQDEHRWLTQLVGDWTYEVEAAMPGGDEPTVGSTVGPGVRDDGTTARYRDVITLDGPDARTLTSDVEQPDGSWQRFMTMRYRRVPEPAGQASARAHPSSASPPPPAAS